MLPAAQRTEAGVLLNVHVKIIHTQRYRRFLKSSELWTLFYISSLTHYFTAVTEFMSEVWTPVRTEQKRIKTLMTHCQ